MTNHQWTSATVMLNATVSDYVRDESTDTTTYTDAEAIPPGATLRGYRGAWWTFVPAETVTGFVSVIGLTDGVYLDVWSKVGGVWTLVDNGENFGVGWYDMQRSWVAGDQYYARVASKTDIGQGIWFQLAYVPTVEPPVPGRLIVDPVSVSVRTPDVRVSAPGVDATAVRVGVAVHMRILGEADIVSADPVTVGVRTPPAMVPLRVSPARVGVRTPGPLLVEAGLTLTQPDNGEVVATYTPTFIVAVDQHDDNLTYTIELRYDDNLLFTDPVTVSSDVDPVVGGVFLTPSTPVPDITYWQVRLLLDGVEQVGWTPWRLFEVDTSDAGTTLTVTWDVSAAQTREIHLWHFDPPGPEAGDTVTAYGQGFPLTPGHISVADIPIEIESWTLVPATADPMVINASTVEPEHFEVVFTAPEVDNGGGPFVVEA